LDSERVQEEEVSDEVKVLEEVAAEVGLDFEAQLDLRKTAFVPIVEQLFHTGEDCLVFRQNVLIALHP